MAPFWLAGMLLNRNATALSIVCLALMLIGLLVDIHFSSKFGFFYGGKVWLSLASGIPTVVLVFSCEEADTRRIRGRRSVRSDNDTDQPDD